MKEKLLLITAILLAGSVCFGQLIPYWVTGDEASITLGPAIAILIDNFPIPSAGSIDENLIFNPAMTWTGGVFSSVPGFNVMEFTSGYICEAIVFPPFSYWPDPFFPGWENFPPYIEDGADLALYFDPDDEYTFFIDSETQQSYLIVETYPVPEPATLSLLALGGLALLRKRK